MRNNILRTWRAVPLACLFAVQLASCDASTSPEPGDTETPLEGLRMAAHSDTSLTAMVGATVGDVPVVRLTRNGAPAPGIEVRFIVSGGGVLRLASQRTDTAGLASPGAWTLGNQAGVQKVTARSQGVGDVVYTAIAKAARPAAIEIVAGNFQNAPAGAPVHAPLQVRLTDQFGNLTPGESVTFSVLAGHGTIAAERATTDSFGVATSGAWTLGVAGAQALIASASGLMVYFEAFACTAPCPAQELLFVRQDGLYKLADGVVTLMLPQSGIYHASWSPAAGRIAFDTYDFLDEISSIYLMDAAGTNVELVASGFWSHSWSPDGGTLAIVGNDGIYTLRVDQANAAPVRLIENGSSPAWSPDGSHIAFVRFSDHTLNMVNADGSALTTIMQDDNFYFEYPVWSPDGERLAFSRCAASDDGCNIMAVDANGANLTQLTESDTGRPSWSPDGSRIVFATSGGIVWIPVDMSLGPLVPMVAAGFGPSWRP